MNATSPSAEAEYRELSSVQLTVDPNGDAKDKREQKGGATQAHAALLAPDGSSRKRFLWWHVTKKQRILVIVGLVLLLLIVLGLIGWFVIIPAIIRHCIRSTEITLNYMDIISIPDDSTLTVNLSLNIRHNVGIAAATDNTTASLLFNGVVFATLPFPGLKIRTGSQNYNLIINTDMKIVDQSAFNAMSSAAINDPEIMLMASAALDARALGLSFGGLRFERKLPLQGFSGFSDPEPVIENIALTSCTSTEYILDIDVTLDNTARMGLDGIGALNMSLYYGQQYLGYALSQKPELGIPRGVSDQSYLVIMDANIVSISSLAMSVFSNNAPFYIVGDNPYVTTHDQFVEALTTVNMSIPSSGGALSTMKLGASCNLLSILS
ncbi:hypothetical protein PHYBOEH_007949 [Phytophthora boehmeriae]|uniref:Uncharacterized protein n=1 Tax=Phytophthora boehmeriae TaxID=109152 RepID=A0A8T1X240_9STRA|nr:hypothetical protein PHYBOEH_007949 [Phytophthora boehmeriae]